MVMTHLRTLVVEDDPDHAKLLQIELKRMREIDFDTTCCDNISDALDTLESDRFDLIILDYWLGSENSMTVVDWVRQSELGTPMVIATSADDVYLATSLTRAGAHRFIRKQDLGTPMLAEVIREALHESHTDSRRFDERQDARGLIDKLTPREREIASLIAEGLLSKQIALHLGCAEGTVNLHRTHIMAKTGAQSVADLVRIVLLTQSPAT